MVGVRFFFFLSFLLFSSALSCIKLCPSAYLIFDLSTLKWSVCLSVCDRNVRVIISVFLIFKSSGDSGRRLKCWLTQQKTNSMFFFHALPRHQPATNTSWVEVVWDLKNVFTRAATNSLICCLVYKMPPNREMWFILKCLVLSTTQKYSANSQERRNDTRKKLERKFWPFCLDFWGQYFEKRHMWLSNTCGEVWHEDKIFDSLATFTGNSVIIDRSAKFSCIVVSKMF